MPVGAFKREVDRRGPFYDLVSRYSQALQVLMMQSTACNTLHAVEERCSRWLLMTHDRVEGDEFQLTHEFLGYMLGVRRPTVSLVLGTLDKAGIIQNGSKKITVVDRQDWKTRRASAIKWSGARSTDYCPSNSRDI